MDLRDQIRSKTVGAKKDFKGEVIAYEGLEIEIREPSEKQRAAIFDRANSQVTVAGKPEVKVDVSELSVWAMICCCYVPDTDTAVFTEADYDCLINMPASQLDSIKKKVLEYLNIDREKLAKNSEATTGDITNSNLPMN